MGAKSKIEWLQGPDGELGATWNPIRARNKKTGRVGWHCEKVSPGCTHCYAEAMNLWRGTELPYAPASLGDLELFLDEKTLEQPLRWKRPRAIFPCSMTDLFGKFVPDKWIFQIYTVMALAGPRGHTFLTLTKRPERRLELLTETEHGRGIARMDYRHIIEGVSVSNQGEADKLLPTLLSTPAALRAVSYEPALGPANFTFWLSPWNQKTQPYRYHAVPEDIPALDLLIIGGESSQPRKPARPCEVGWIWDVVDQCKAAGVACFVKQLGSNVRVGFDTFEKRFDGRMSFCDYDKTAQEFVVKVKHPKGGDPSEWPEGLRVRQFPTVKPE